MALLILSPASEVCTQSKRRDTACETSDRHTRGPHLPGWHSDPASAGSFFSMPPDPPGMSLKETAIGLIASAGARQARCVRPLCRLKPCARSDERSARGAPHRRIACTGFAGRGLDPCSGLPHWSAHAGAGPNCPAPWPLPIPNRRTSHGSVEVRYLTGKGGTKWSMQLD